MNVMFNMILIKKTGIGWIDIRDKRSQNDINILFVELLNTSKICCLQI